MNRLSIINNDLSIIVNINIIYDVITNKYYNQTILITPIDSIG